MQYSTITTQYFLRIHTGHRKKVLQEKGECLSFRMRECSSIRIAQKKIYRILSCIASYRMYYVCRSIYVCNNGTYIVYLYYFLTSKVQSISISPPTKSFIINQVLKFNSKYSTLKFFSTQKHCFPYTGQWLLTSCVTSYQSCALSKREQIIHT